MHGRNDPMTLINQPDRIVPIGRLTDRAPPAVITRSRWIQIWQWECCDACRSHVGSMFQPVQRQVKFHQFTVTIHLKLLLRSTHSGTVHSSRAQRDNFIIFPNDCDMSHWSMKRIRVTDDFRTEEAIRNRGSGRLSGAAALHPGEPPSKSAPAGTDRPNVEQVACICVIMAFPFASFRGWIPTRRCWHSLCRPHPCPDRRLRFTILVPSRWLSQHPRRT
jgi:hypothetical protein